MRLRFGKVGDVGKKEAGGGSVGGSPGEAGDCAVEQNKCRLKAGTGV